MNISSPNVEKIFKTSNFNLSEVENQQTEISIMEKNKRQNIKSPLTYRSSGNQDFFERSKSQSTPNKCRLI